MITGNIYKIINNQNEDIYIGSTIEKLSSRMSGHRSKFRKWKEGLDDKKCMSYDMFDAVGVENCKIILIENGQFVSKPHLKMKEQYYIDTNVCINKVRAHRSEEVIELQNKIRDKKYRETHRDELCEKRKLFYQENKDELCEKMKIYREAHRDELNIKKREKMKIYYQENRDEINRIRREKYALKKSSLNI